MKASNIAETAERKSLPGSMKEGKNRRSVAELGQSRQSGQGVPRVRSISNTRLLVAPQHTAGFVP
jgi:hypothetical protein